jgi:hypothetical protein
MQRTFSKSSLRIRAGLRSPLATRGGDEDKLRELYLLAYSREPSADELALAKNHLDKPRKAPDGQPLDAARSKRAGYEDVVWAILNTKEFLFNH